MTVNQQLISLELLKAHVNRVFIHKQTHKRYRLLSTCKVWMESGNWIDGVVYAPELKREPYYVRPAPEFADKFELMGEEE